MINEAEHLLQPSLICDKFVLPRMKDAEKKLKSIGKKHNTKLRKHPKEDDIDKIFSGLDPVKETRSPKNDEESDESKYFSVGKDARKYCDGLPVYTVEELQLGEGGGDTEDCPIYCDCCT